MMAYSEDHIALAAEYALGTLDAAERAQVQTMMAVDTGYAAFCDAWVLRLSVLNQMVGLVEPRAEVWERIKAAIARQARPAPGARAGRRCAELRSCCAVAGIRSPAANRGLHSGRRAAGRSRRAR